MVHRIDISHGTWESKNISIVASIKNITSSMCRPLWRLWCIVGIKFTLSSPLIFLAKRPKCHLSQFCISFNIFPPKSNDELFLYKFDCTQTFNHAWMATFFILLTFLFGALVWTDDVGLNGVIIKRDSTIERWNWKAILTRYIQQ